MLDQRRLFNQGLALNQLLGKTGNFLLIFVFYLYLLLLIFVFTYFYRRRC